LITLITLHIVNPENRDKALWLLTENTRLARKAKGFISREIFFSKKDPNKGYSITSWETEADMDRFLKSPERPPLDHEGPEKRVYLNDPSERVLLFSSTDSDRYELVPVP
jgi:heme-degrading monooxygenase HmoA